MENKQSMLEKLLKRIGEFGQAYHPKFANIPSNCLVQTQQKTKELKRFVERYHPSTGLLDEILACYSFGQLIQQGVPILDVLGSTADSFRELHHDEPAKAIMHIHDSVRMGDTFSEPMSQKNFFSPESTYLAGIGEETGDLDRTMLRASDVLEAKETYGLRPEQISEIVFYYGATFLADAGLNSVRSIAILAEYSRQFLIGTSPRALDIVRRIEEKNTIRQKLLNSK